MDYETLQFDHNTTNFDLEGTHEQTDCKACHNTLVFEGAPTDCISCHTDVHTQSLGNDCIRCHTSDSWLVFTIPEIHEENGFPLIGVHTNLSCVECHTNESTMIFTPIGNECIQCHRDDYMATQDPNHPLSGFSQNCDECHDPFGMGWEDITGINHDFFPLTLGHDVQDCSQCHDVGNFSDVTDDCFACHEEDYVQSMNPNHQEAGFPIDCVQCHTTAIKRIMDNRDADALASQYDIPVCVNSAAAARQEFEAVPVRGTAKQYAQTVLDILSKLSEEFYDSDGEYTI